MSMTRSDLLSLCSCHPTLIGFSRQFFCNFWQTWTRMIFTGICYCSCRFLHGKTAYTREKATLVHINAYALKQIYLLFSTFSDIFPTRHQDPKTGKKLRGTRLHLRIQLAMRWHGAYPPAAAMSNNKNTIAGDDTVYAHGEASHTVNCARVRYLVFRVWRRD